MIKLPVPSSCIITQDFDQHNQRAALMGCCSRPGQGCTCYYYGGIDYAPPGSVTDDVVVTASTNGFVTTGNQGKVGYGIHARQTNGNLLIIYAHLARLMVGEGEYVQAGEPIGIMGNTGNSTGRHLHWEVRDENGIPVNPLTLLQQTTPDPTPDPGTTPSGFNIPVFPALPQAIVNVNQLRIRSKPVSGSTLGYLVTGETVSVIDSLQDRQDVWFKIISDRLGILGWSAAFYRGQVWIEAI